MQTLTPEQVLSAAYKACASARSAVDSVRHDSFFAPHLPALEAGIARANEQKDALSGISRTESIQIIDAVIRLKRSGSYRQHLLEQYEKRIRAKRMKCHGRR